MKRYGRRVGKNRTCHCVRVSGRVRCVKSRSTIAPQQGGDTLSMGVPTHTLSVPPPDSVLPLEGEWMGRQQQSGARLRWMNCEAV